MSADAFHRGRAFPGSRISCLGLTAEVAEGAAARRQSRVVLSGEHEC